MPGSAGSVGSSGTGPSRPATTSWRSATRPPSRSRCAANGRTQPDWFASVSLLADGTTEVEHGDPARDEHHRAIVTASPADIAGD
jgi:hypothetical protein